MTLRLRPTLSAVYPLVQLPTGDESRGLGAGHVLAFLPIWAQKSFGDWTTYGGGGYWINQGGVGDKDYWFFGGLLKRKVTDRLSIAGEIFHQTANSIDESNHARLRATVLPGLSPRQGAS